MKSCIFLNVEIENCVLGIFFLLSIFFLFSGQLKNFMLIYKSIKFAIF